MFDREVPVRADVFDLISAVLRGEQISFAAFGYPDIKLQLPPTVMLAQGGELRLNPPANVEAKVGPLEIGTTIRRAVCSSADTITIKLDTSPINVKLRRR